MMDYVKIYTVAALCFVAMDYVWLTLVAKNFYRKHIGNLLATKPNLVAAGLYYLVYVFGLLLLVILPAARAHSLMQVIWSGALFGLVGYATYDLTSQAVIRGWSAKVTVVDLLWGSLVTAITAVISHWVAIVLFV